MAAAASLSSDARLTNIEGTVLVDSGIGFVRVLEDVDLKLGDRVMVTDNGGAFLRFGEGCAFPLEAPSMTTVTETACTVTTQDGDGINAGVIVLGLGALGVGGFVLFNVLNEEDEEPVSP